MSEIQPLPPLDEETAKALRISRDLSDAVAYAFAVPHLTRKPLKPIVIGWDFAKQDD